MLKTAIYGGLVGLIALIVAVLVAMNSLPSYGELRKRDDLGQMIRVRAADGTVMLALGPSFGEWLPYAQIPEVMRDAMIAVEDRRFLSHPGVDPLGIVRAAKVRVERGHWAQGGSTITQQLARNIFLTNSRTFGRKIREAILALAIERRFSKEQILELYLNRVYFGGGAYGIDAAARRFYGHSAKELSLSEAAIIAGLVKAPSNYSPTADAEAAKGRAGVVIRAMVENGDVTPVEAASAAPADVKFVPTPRQNSVRYFTDWVLPQLDTLIDETTAPIEVWTTLDLEMQRAADRAINANTPSGAQGALVALDRDGSVRAMVGGRDYVSSLYNRATQAVRQPGSAFKLFVYLAALEAGHTPSDTVVDGPVTIGGWSPRNSSRSFSGPISLREAFSRSVNTVSAKLGQEVGFRNVADMAQRMGITTPVNTTPSMVLGTSEARLLDMTRAFASVSRKGVAVVPYGIRRVTTGEGQLLYQHESDDSRVLLTPWVAAQMTDLLQSAVLTGTGRAAQIGRPVAGKTGTTSSNKDGWFVGFSSGITTGVWMGRDDAKAIPGLQGGRAPAAAFRDFMSTAVAKRPVEAFDIEVTLPDWQTEPDEEAWYGEPDNFMMVDPDGNPIGGGPDYGPPFPEDGSLPPGAPPETLPPGRDGRLSPPILDSRDPRDPRDFPRDSRDPRVQNRREGDRLDQEWLDRAIGRNRPPPPAPPPQQGRQRNDVPPQDQRRPAEQPQDF
nr:PBP1A family penicillin-binding protein [Allosphingosinicella indica]